MQISTETVNKLVALHRELTAQGMSRKVISWRLLNLRMVLEPDLRTRKERERALAA